jgi:hypothetical protein
VERVLAIQEPPRIAPGALPPIDAVLAPRADAAAVAGVLLFADDVIYERIAPKRAAASAASALGVQSNLAAIVAAATGAVLTAPAPLPSEAAPTTTTTAPRALRRTVQIVREWAAFDFSEIPDDDRTKHGGSFAINPVTLLRLTTGVLTGSIEPKGSYFKANVSRDKAERNLSEDERDVLDKMFTANAVTRRVFPAQFTLSPNGELTSFQVTLRQQLSSKDRADLTVNFQLRPGQSAATIKRPARKGTVQVRSLNQLVTTVSGA